MTHLFLTYILYTYRHSANTTASFRNSSVIALTVKNERFLVKILYFTWMKLLQRGVLPCNNRNRPSLNVLVKIGLLVCD